jgi:hypothetical protein
MLKLFHELCSPPLNHHECIDVNTCISSGGALAVGGPVCVILQNIHVTHHMML